MNWIWLLSGFLAAATAALHLVAGGRDIARPLITSALNEEVKLTMYACWHLVSASLVVSALTLLATGIGLLDTATRPLVLFISVLWLLFGVVFLVISLGMARPSGLFRFPQWVLLIPVGVLGILGLA